MTTIKEQGIAREEKTRVPPPAQPTDRETHRSHPERQREERTPRGRDPGTQQRNDDPGDLDSDDVQGS